MPRMSKKCRLERAFFLNERNRVTYNELCRKCRHPCKQSCRAVVIECPKYLSKRSRRRGETENMDKSLEELQKEYEDGTARLEQEKRKLRRLENRKAYLESGSRKQRNHRLITRGAAVESVMPEVKILTEQEFYSLMERISEWQPVQNMVRLFVERQSQPLASEKDGD